jgi:hypothetical protein
MHSRPLHNTTFFLMTTCTYHGYWDLGFKLSRKNRFSTVVLSILYTMGRRYLDHCTLGLFPFFSFSALRSVFASDSDGKAWSGGWEAGASVPA